MVDLMEYIKNPVLFTQVSGNFTLMQLKIIESIIYQLQDHINNRLSRSSLGPLFENLPESEQIPVAKSGNLLTFQIPLASLGIPRQKYGELDSACEALMTMQNSYYEYDETLHQETRVIKNIFHEVRVPTSELTADGLPQNFSGGKRRKGYIEIKMVDDCAREILSLRKGYTEYLFGVPRLCHSARTPRLYTYLSAWRTKGERLFSYNDLKEWFGVLKYNKSRTKIENDQFKKYAEFRRYCLEPAQKEMQKLAEEGKLDFYFEYEPVYKNGKTRGNPSSVLFKIFDGPRGMQNNLNKQREQLHSQLIARWNIQPEDWDIILEYIEKLPMTEIITRVSDIDNQIRISNPGSVRAFAMKILQKWGTQRLRELEAFEERERMRIEQEVRMEQNAQGGQNAREQYLADLRAAYLGDEKMRQEYPNWEFLCQQNHINQ